MAIAVYWLVRTLALELPGPVVVDGPIYRTVAHGMLRGLKPYVDLFESKPPAIYFIYLLPERLLTLFQVLLFASAPFLVRRKEAFVLTVPLVILLQEVGGSLQSEGFGAVFGMLYVAAYGNVTLSAIALLLAIGTKEPFLLTGVASALVLTNGYRDFLKHFVIPLCLAAILGVGILLTTGLLVPYLTVYLPAMQYRVSGGDALWMRLLSVNRLFARMTSLSSLPVTGYVIAAGALAVPYFHDRKWRSLAATATLILAIHFSYVVFKWWSLLRSYGFSDFTDPWFVVIVCGYLVLCTVAAVLVWRSHWKSVAIVVACMLASLAILAGGKQLLPQHFAFGIPVLFAIVKQLQTHAPKAVLVAAVAATAVGLLTYQQDPRVLAETNEKLSMTQRALAADTEAFDRMMDRCRFDRFVYLGGFPLLAHSRYSPIGPLFNTHHHYLPANHPLFQQTFANAASADVLVFSHDRGFIADSPLVRLKEDFNGDVPECAEGVSLSRLSLHFRP